MLGHVERAWAYSFQSPRGGAQILELLQQLDKRAGVRVAHSVVLTRMSTVVTTRAMAAIKQLLSERGVAVLDTPIAERVAFRDIFDCGGTLRTMDPQRISNLDKARENARLFAEEVLRLVPVRRGALAACRSALETRVRAA